MTNEELQSQFRELIFNQRVSINLPISDEEIEAQLNALRVDLPALKAFYKVTNGLEEDWFCIFPLKDSANSKKTWNNLERANDVNRTEYLREHPELLERFIIFASIGGGNCAVFDRTDGSIWYQEDGLHQTDLSLFDFISTELREVKEL